MLEIIQTKLSALGSRAITVAKIQTHNYNFQMTDNKQNGIIRVKVITLGAAECGKVSVCYLHTPSISYCLLLELPYKKILRKTFRFKVHGNHWHRLWRYQVGELIMYSYDVMFYA